MFKLSQSNPKRLRHLAVATLIFAALTIGLADARGMAASTPSDLSASTKASLPERLLEPVRAALGPQDTHAEAIIDADYRIYLPIVMREFTGNFAAQFELQTGSPAYINDERGCEHMGVGGKVYDTQGVAIIGLAVRISGELAGVPVGPLDTLTGSAADRFGVGGYYLELSDTPTASEDTLLLQVLDASSGLELSEQVPLTTFDTCEQNLVFVNWAQVEE